MSRLSSRGPEGPAAIGSRHATRLLRRLRLLAMTVGAVPTAVLAAQAPSQSPPAPGTPKNFTLPPKDELTLPNGMAVTLVPYGTLPKSVVRLVLRSGNVDEAADQVWLADITGTMLKEGTRTRNAERIAADAARMGGSIDVDVTPDLTSVGGEVLAEFTPDLVRLVADVARNPTFPERSLARVRNDYARQLSVAKSQPDQLASERFHRVLYGDHPYGRLFPTEPMIRGYTTEQLRAFHREHYVGARAHLYVVGRFDAPAVKTAIRQAFDGWTRGTPARTTAPAPKSTRRIYIVDRPGAPQTTIYMGLPVIDPSQRDYTALVVTNALLGGSFASRITSNIREDKGYTYSPFSQVSVRYRDGYWAQAADVTTAVTGPSLKEIFYEIDRLRDTPPDADELKRIQNYVAGVFVLQNSSRTGIAQQLAFVRLHGLGDGYLTERVSRINAVTSADVQRVTQTYLRPDEMTIVLVGDRKAIEEQVKPYGELAP